MDSSVSLRNWIWFLRVCHLDSAGLYQLIPPSDRRFSTLFSTTYITPSSHITTLQNTLSNIIVQEVRRFEKSTLSSSLRRQALYSFKQVYKFHTFKMTIVRQFMIPDFSRIVGFTVVKGTIRSWLNCAVLCKEAERKPEPNVLWHSTGFPSGLSGIFCQFCVFSCACDYGG